MTKEQFVKLKDEGYTNKMLSQEFGLKTSQAIKLARGTHHMKVGVNEDNLNHLRVSESYELIKKNLFELLKKSKKAIFKIDDPIALNTVFLMQDQNLINCRYINSSKKTDLQEFPRQKLYIELI